VLQLGIVGGGILGVTLLAAWLVNRDITHSLGDLRGAMGRLAHGDLATDVPGTTRRDEVGDMAQAVLVFREQMVERSQLAAEQVDGQRAAEEKRAALIHMADSIEAATEAALEQIRQRIVVMTATADKMTASADRTGVAAGTASTAAANALSNAQTVASAAEQLTASIREIGGQVNRSSQVVSQAVAAGAETRATIEALNQQVEQIGAVANMIGEIAARTNLLALNATIEAARAGDAGKGFAVVASEVKALANQTARSTQEISRHIGLVRSATGASVSAVLRIEQTITDISAIAGSIAAAVEQQSATTAEIARNVVETAATATEMTTRTSEVSSEAGQTSHHAEAVRDNASGLNAAMGDLRHSLIRVVRTATSDVDRRIHRRFDVDLPARLTAAGQSCEVRVIDLSDGGARVRGMTALQVGERGTLDIKGVGFPLPVVVNRCDDDILRLTFVLDEEMAARLSGTAERLAQRQAA
jgi:methyl-accepting chemotaxis protein